METVKTFALQDGIEEKRSSESQRGADLNSYVSRLTRERLLSAEEEITLSRRIQQGDQQARERLIEANMRLVITLARNYQNSLIPFEDLVQEGAIGLMTAAERFDASLGFRFSTYATHWIKQAICRAIDNKSKPIRLPAHVSETLRKIERTRAALLREEGVEPSAEQIAERLGITVRKVQALLQAGQEPVSLDMLVGDDENTTLASLLNDENAVDPQDRVITEEMHSLLEALLAILTPREREVMRLRMGFEGESSRILQEIGATMHISRERVRQIEMQALRKLKYAAKRRDLRGYLQA